MELIILGAGGFGRVVADVARQLGRYEIVRHLDDKAGENVVGELSAFTSKVNADTEFFVSFGNNALRREWLDKISQAGGRIATLIHPRAYVSPTANIASGCIVMPMAIVNTECRIARGCIVDSASIVDHGCLIEECSHICPGAIVRAENRIEAGSRIASGTVIEARTFSMLNA